MFSHLKPVFNSKATINEKMLKDHYYNFVYPPSPTTLVLGIYIKMDEDMRSQNHPTLTVVRGDLFVVVLQAAQISRASPAWQSYIKYVSGVVMEGLKTSTHTSLRSMLNQIVFSNMSQVSIFSGLYI